MKTESGKYTRSQNEDPDMDGVVPGGAGDVRPRGGDGGRHNLGGVGAAVAVGGVDSARAADKSYKFVQSEVRRLDYERIRKVLPEVRDDGRWTAHFIASSNPNLAEKYARHFHEESAFVGCNGIELNRLYGGDMDSTPFLSALMQLSAIQAVASAAEGRDLAIGCSIWDCFFGAPHYSESMDSMWRYLYKVFKLGGVGRIDFTILFDASLQGGDMERQKRYVGFCSSFFKKLGAGRRMSLIMVDKKLKKQLWQQTTTSQK